MPAELEALLFDMDGLLVDSEPHFYEAHRAVFAEHGVVISPEEYARVWIIRGARTQDEAVRRGVPADPEALRAEVMRRFRASVARGLALMPGARALLERARGRFRTAVVTNTTRAEAVLVLERLGLAPLLDRVVAREDYARAKPAPDAYLAGAAAVGAAPAACLALEDSPRGIASAAAAGIRCVAVPNALTRIEPPAGAWRVLDTLAALDLEEMAAAWRRPA